MGEFSEASRMAPSPRGTGLQLMQFKNPASTKNENKNNGNSTLKKINRPVAIAVRFPSHPARALLICTFADGSSRGRERWQRWQREYSRGRWGPPKPRH